MIKMKRITKMIFALLIFLVICIISVGIIAAFHVFAETSPILGLIIILIVFIFACIYCIKDIYNTI